MKTGLNLNTGLINDVKKECNKANEVLVDGIDFLVNESSIPVPKYWYCFNENDEGYLMNRASTFLLALYVMYYVFILYCSINYFILAVVPSCALIPFMIWWYKNRTHCPLYELIPCYGHGITAYTVSSIVVGILDYIYNFLGMNSLFFRGYGVVIAIYVTTMIVVGEFFKCVAYANTATHKSVKKSKRPMIVALIISLGFGFAESLALLSIIERTNHRFSWDLMTFIGSAFAIGTPLHVICGYLSGILNSLDSNRPFRSCIYIIPARSLYSIFHLKFLLSSTIIDFFSMLAVSVGVVWYLAFLISTFKAEIPGVSSESYMSLLMTYDNDNESENDADKTNTQEI